MNLVKTLESGAALEVTMGSFVEGLRLFKAVMKELEAVKISLGIREKSIQDIFTSEVNDEILDTLKNVLSRIVSSQAIEEALWPCMKRAIYSGQKITPLLFEDEKIREDFLIVSKEVLWFNLSPFFKNLGSLFTELKQKSIGSPKPQ